MRGARAGTTDTDRWEHATRSRAGGGRVAYVVRSFPLISQTFVLNELLALDALGIDARVFALERSRARREHRGTKAMRARTERLPGDENRRRAWRKNRKTIARRPVAWLSGFLRARRREEGVRQYLQAGMLAARCIKRGIRHLHAHFADEATIVAAEAARLARISFSFTAHAYDVFREDVDRALLVRNLRAARFVVTVSDYHVRYLRELAGDSVRVERIYNGIDLERFTPAPAPPPPPLRIACVARLIEKKGIGVLIDACRVLRDRGVDFRCELVGAGEGRERFERQAEVAGLGERFSFLGARVQDDVIALYRRSHVFALPCLVAEDGDRDGLPVAIVEALACGLPVVTTAVTGIPEAVSNDGNGFIVPERDAEAVAAAIERLANDGALRARLGSAARTSVATKFDQSASARRLAALFEETVG